MDESKQQNAMPSGSLFATIVGQLEDKMLALQNQFEDINTKLDAILEIVTVEKEPDEEPHDPMGRSPIGSGKVPEADDEG